MSDDTELSLSREIDVTVNATELSRIIGEQLILDAEDHNDHGYLAGIALDGVAADGRELEETLLEFIRNSTELDVDSETADEIEGLLR